MEQFPIRSNGQNCLLILNPFLSFLSPLSNCKENGQYQLHELIEARSSAASSLVDNLAKTLQKKPRVGVLCQEAIANVSHLGI